MESDGFQPFSEEAFLNFFADGVPTEKAKTLFAVQQPIAADLFAGRTKSKKRSATCKRYLRRKAISWITVGV